jgi:hypothetical protein
VALIADDRDRAVRYGCESAIASVVTTTTTYTGSKCSKVV